MRMAVASVSAVMGFELLASELAHAAVERIRAVRLDDGKLRQARDQFKIAHFDQRLANRRAVSEIAAGDDDVVRRLPRELLHEFDGGGFLAFDAIRIHRIQQIDRFLADEVVEDADASIEIGAELAGEGAVVERLRKFAPGNLAFRNQHQAAHVAARRIGGHGGRSVASGSAGNPGESSLVRKRGCERHARVFKRCGRVHALVLGAKILDPSRARAPWQAVEWRVSFAQGDGVLFRNVGKEFAEAPDSALVERIA